MGSYGSAEFFDLTGDLTVEVGAACGADVVEGHHNAR